MIRHHSIIPFDLGASLRPKVALDRMLAAGYRSDRVPNFLPAGWIQLGLPERTGWLFLHPSGFGCLAVQPFEILSPVSDETVAETLVRRRRFHTAVIQGTDPLALEIVRIRGLLSGRCRAVARELLFWESCPYVLSFFGVHLGKTQRLSSATVRRRIAALVEPSIVLGEDCPGEKHGCSPEEIAGRIGKVDLGGCETILTDFDLSEDSSVFITWAGVVIVSAQRETLDAISEEVLALEVRLQTGWTMLHYVNRWKHVALSRSRPARDLTQLRWELARMIETTEDLVDASVPSRLRRIYSELIASSGFEDEKRKAERGVAAATEYGKLSVERAEHKYRIVVEALLFLFAFCQVIPLLFDVPLLRLPTWALWVSLAGACFVIMLRYARLRK